MTGHRDKAEAVARQYDKPDSCITDEAYLLRGVLHALLALGEQACNADGTPIHPVAYPTIGTEPMRWPIP